MEETIAPPPSPRLPSLVLLVLVLPLSVLAALTAQRPQIQAAKPASMITNVRINPGQIRTYPGAPPIPLSALAYDQRGKPLHARVLYEWGLSSTGSIAKLVPNDKISLLYPLNSGSGTLWVKAKNSTGQVVGAVTVLVSTDFAPLPTPTPLRSKPPRPSSPK